MARVLGDLTAHPFKVDGYNEGGLYSRRMDNTS